MNVHIHKYIYFITCIAVVNHRCTHTYIYLPYTMHLGKIQVHTLILTDNCVAKRTAICTDRNGKNLHSWPHHLRTMPRFYQKRTPIPYILRTMLRFHQKRKLLLQRKAPFKNALRAILRFHLKKALKSAEQNSMEQRKSILPKKAMRNQREGGWNDT